MFSDDSLEKKLQYQLLEEQARVQIMSERLELLSYQVNDLKAQLEKKKNKKPDSKACVFESAFCHSSCLCFRPRKKICLTKILKKSKMEYFLMTKDDYEYQIDVARSIETINKLKTRQNDDQTTYDGDWKDYLTVIDCYRRILVHLRNRRFKSNDGTLNQCLTLWAKLSYCCEVLYQKQYPTLYDKPVLKPTCLCSVYSMKDVDACVVNAAVNMFFESAGKYKLNRIVELDFVRLGLKIKF